MKRKQKPCSRIIQASKYERTRGKNREWWQRLFDAIEAEASIVSFRTVPNVNFKYLHKICLKPSDKKVEVLARIFPTNLLAKILSMISIEADADATCENRKTLSTISIASRLGKLKMDSEDSCSVTELEENDLAKLDNKKGYG